MMALSKAANDLKANAGELGQELEQRLEDLKREVANISKTLAAIGTQKAEDYRVGVEKLASDAMAVSHQAIDRAKAEAASLEESLENQVRAHPMRAIGIAAGIGFMIAM